MLLLAWLDCSLLPSFGSELIESRLSITLNSHKTALFNSLQHHLGVFLLVHNHHTHRGAAPAIMFLYTVTLSNRTFQILSQDDETAAFAALELAHEKGERLLDVSPTMETL